MRRTIAIAILAASPFAFAPQGAQADHSSCGTTVIFSSPVNLNPNAGRCIAQTLPTYGVPELEAAPSTAFIHPQSTSISARFLAGSNLGVTVFAKFNGMGIDNKIVPMPFLASNNTYNTAYEAVVPDQTIAGCVTVSVFHNDVDENNNPITVELSSAAYHGWAGTC